MNTTAIATTGNNQIMQGNAVSLYDEWLSYLDVKPKSAETYRRAMNTFWAYMRNAGISNPQRADVIAFRDSLKGNHTASTIQTYLAAIKLFFKWTASRGLYPNVADHIKGERVTDTYKKDPLTATQAKAVADTFDTQTVKGKRDYAMFVLMVNCGLRTVELIRANIEDIRTVGDVTILAVQGKGKDDKGQLVVLDSFTENAIRDYLKTRKDIKGTDPLFTGESNRNNGERMKTRTLSEIIKEAMRKAGLNSPRLTAHSLRHTFATIAFNSGASLEDVQQGLRHSNINTTMRYLHTASAMQNKSSSRVAGAIFG